VRPTIVAEKTDNGEGTRPKEVEFTSFNTLKREEEFKKEKKGGLGVRPSEIRQRRKGKKGKKGN